MGTLQNSLPAEEARVIQIRHAERRNQSGAASGGFAGGTGTFWDQWECMGLACASQGSPVLRHPSGPQLERSCRMRQSPELDSAERVWLNRCTLLCVQKKMMPCKIRYLRLKCSPVSCLAPAGVTDLLQRQRTREPLAEVAGARRPVFFLIWLLWLGPSPL